MTACFAAWAGTLMHNIRHPRLWHPPYDWPHPRPPRSVGRGTWSAARRTADRSGPCGRLEAGRSGEAGLTAGLAQRRRHRLQRGLERPVAHAQHRAGRVCLQRVNPPSAGWPASQDSIRSSHDGAPGPQQRRRRQAGRPIPRLRSAGTGRARLPGPPAAAPRSQASGRARGRSRAWRPVANPFRSSRL
jgi:hypothetical protein